MLTTRDHIEMHICILADKQLEYQTECIADCEYSYLHDGTLYEKHPIYHLAYESNLVDILGKIPIQDHSFYNYLIFDPRYKSNRILEEVEITKRFQCFYIGKGTMKRYNGHFTPGFILSGSHRANKIKAIIRDGYKPILIFINTEVDEDNANGKEIELISYFGREDLKKGKLVNKTEGGEGRSGYIPTKDQRKRMSDCAIGKRTGIDNPTARPVYQYTLSGEFIKRYNCVTDAIRELGKALTCVGNITTCMNGKMRTAYNYQWFPEYKGDRVKIVRYKSQDDRRGIENTRFFKSVIQYDNATGTPIQTFISIKQASTDTGVPRAAIGRSCKGFGISDKRFNWKLK